MNWAILIAAVIAALASVTSVVVTYRSTKKTTFINVITSERIKWMGSLRDSISQLCGFTYHWAIMGKIEPTENQKIVKDIDRLRMLVKLQLNPDESKHKEIITLVDDIPNNTSPERRTQLLKILDSIVVKNQKILKDEWERVKKEANL